MELNIYHLYPDVLNLYGDRGNVLCMQRRLEWRGMQANVVNVPIGEKFTAKDCDLIFIGGGQDFEQAVLLDDLKGAKTAELKAAIEDGVPVLAICGGYQMLGQYYKTWDGQQCDFTGALDLYTVGSEQRMIGNYMFTCEEAGCNIVGFENHSGKTYLGSGVRPLGKILEGYGNNGEDGTEGARYKNVFASYSHGCLLPKNPKLADLLLKTALERKYGEAELSPLADEFETAAHNYMEARLSRKSMFRAAANRSGPVFYVFSLTQRAAKSAKRVAAGASVAAARAMVRLAGGSMGRISTPSVLPRSSSDGMTLTPSPCRTMAMTA